MLLIGYIVFILSQNSITKCFLVKGSVSDPYSLKPDPDPAKKSVYGSGSRSRFTMLFQSSFLTNINKF